VQAGHNAVDGLLLQLVELAAFREFCVAQKLALPTVIFLLSDLCRKKNNYFLIKFYNLIIFNK
jgi:hypothetical protein